MGFFGLTLRKNGRTPLPEGLLIAGLVLALSVTLSSATKNDTDPVTGLPLGVNCNDGLVVPIWRPFTNLSGGDRFGRGLLYILFMVYLFIGVSIVSDRFMESIEMITAQEKEVSIKDPKTGKKQIIIVKVWNETVANLTLMALGSSAPEILLSVIEIWAKNFKAGDLGPGTIVGSAAFNLFMIIGLCMYVIPDDEVRKIKHLRVFLVTATWSVFAYIWLYLILGTISYGKVEPWEGLVTFLFFPATVYTAYVADRRLFCYKYMSKSYRMNKRGMIVQTEKADPNDIESRAQEKFKDFDEDVDPALAEFERHRREYINAMKRIRLENPDIDMMELEMRAREEVMSKGPKSRAYYRMQATRKLAGKQDIQKTLKAKLHEELDENKHQQEEESKEEAEEKKDDGVTRIFFDPPHYTVMENVGQFEVTIVREGGDLKVPVQIDYKTEDGTACSPDDYTEAVGTLTFAAGETEKKVTLEVMDDDVFEEDEHFYMRLSNVRRKDGIEIPSINVEDELVPSLQLGTPAMATVMILDDDHGGVFQFEEHEAEIVESIGTFELKVARISGARGKVAIPYTTEDGTAKAGKDFEHVEGELIFENEENAKIIEIPIMEEDSYEKNVIMYVTIGEPRHIADCWSDKRYRRSMSTCTSYYINTGIDESSIADDKSNPLDEEPGQAGTGEGVNYEELDAKDPESLTEEEKIALLGRPRLGDITKIQIRIKESKEFKSSVDRMMQRGNASMLTGANSWKDQFLEAFTVQAGDDDEEEEEGEEKMPTCGDYIMHFLTLFWKVIFCVIPPSAFGRGYPAFAVSIAMIGIIITMIADIASHIGCVTGIKESVTAITILALGTSVPGIYGGYLTFVVSILAIGVVTAIIGDVASHLGCFIYLKDSVNAIAFVALGTSVPGIMNGYPCFVISIAMIGACTAIIGDVAGHLGCFIYLKDSVNAIAFVALGTSVPGIANGYPCFVISIMMIGVCTAVIGDVAGHLGCFIYLKDSVNAIAFVALGTSVPDKLGGWPAFVVSIFGIGVLTAVIGDVAAHFGCISRIKEQVTAITIVSLGTSVPDTFASKVAAIQDETADASVGNVTGSNAVNVFLGIGIAWSMAAVYWWSQGEVFEVPVGSLGFSVTVFCIEALCAILILLIRRNPAVGGELGGPKKFKSISSGIFVCFWVFYVFISALEAYKVIEPGF